MIRTRVLLCLLVSFGLPNAGAGARELTPEGRFLAEAPLENVDHVTKACPEAIPPFCGPAGSGIKGDCKAVDVKELGVLGGRQYLFARYLEDVGYESGDGDVQDCKADKAALIEIAKPGRARIVWAAATDRDLERIGSSYSFTQLGAEGRVIFALPLCYEGTGGCRQTLLIWVPETGWRRLERDESWDAVYANLPEGYQPHKSAFIDFHEWGAHWVQHLLGPEDPNCCPSGKIRFRLSIKDDRLHVDSHDIITVDDRIAWAKAAEVRYMESGLPAQTLEDWIASHLRAGVKTRWQNADCGALPDETIREQAFGSQFCVKANIRLESRARTFDLLFTDGRRPLFRHGRMSSDDAEAPVDFDRLRDFTRLVSAPLRLKALACPAGTQPKSEKEHAGLFEWCERDGRRDGPYRSWFATGTNLMEKGQYRGGEKSGAWIECDRFGRCRRRFHG